MKIKENIGIGIGIGGIALGLGLAVWIGDYETQGQIEARRAERVEIEQRINSLQYNMPITTEVSQEFYFQLERKIAEEDSLKSRLKVFYK